MQSVKGLSAVGLCIITFGTLLGWSKLRTEINVVECISFIELSEKWTAWLITWNELYCSFIISVCVCASHQNLCSTRTVLGIWRHWMWQRNILSSNSSQQNMSTWPQYWTTHLRDRESKSKNRYKRKWNNSRESNLEREHESAREVNSNNKNKQ